MWLSLHRNSLFRKQTFFRWVWKNAVVTAMQNYIERIWKFLTDVWYFILHYLFIYLLRLQLHIVLSLLAQSKLNCIPNIKLSHYQVDVLLTYREHKKPEFLYCAKMKCILKSSDPEWVLIFHLKNLLKFLWLFLVFIYCLCNWADIYWLV